MAAGEDRRQLTSSEISSETENSSTICPEKMAEQMVDELTNRLPR